MFQSASLSPRRDKIIIMAAGGPQQVLLRMNIKCCAFFTVLDLTVDFPITKGQSGPFK